MYKLFLSIRYLSRRRIAFFAIGAVTLCVAMVLIVVSVMGGFLDMIKERSRGLLGDIVMDNYSLQGFAWYQEFIDDVRTGLPDEIVTATPVIYNYGILRFPDENITKPVKIVGIRLEEAYVVNDFKGSLFYEKFFPGTTTLAEQKQPVWAWDQNGNHVLPPDLQQALDGTGWKRPQKKSVAGEDVEVAHSLHFPGPGRYASWPTYSTLRAESLLVWVERLARQAESPDVSRAPDLPDRPVGDELAELLVKCDQLRTQLLEWQAGDDGLSALQRFTDELTWSAAHVAANDQEKLIESLGRATLAGRALMATLVSRIAPTYVGDPLPGIIIGSDLVDAPDDEGNYDRPWPRGHKVLLTFLPLTRKGVLSGVQAPVKAMRYADDSRTGVYQIDSLSVYVDFAFAQDVLMMSPQRLTEELGGGMTPERTTQVQFKVAPGHDPYKVKDQLESLWTKFVERKANEIPTGPLDAELDQLGWVQFETWEERQQEFIAAVEKEKVLVTILFGVVSVVAVLLVGCVFYMIVQEKTRDIGIVKSIGATSSGVGSIFLTYGAAVGVVGSIIGATAGALFVWYINEIQGLLIQLNPNLRVWSRKVYSFDYIPNTVKPADIVWIIAIAISASVLGSVVAAWRASRVWPVEAIRYE